jgi:hypothetical protein
MKNYDELVKTGGKLADCIKKNCAKAVKLHSYMDSMSGMLEVVGDIRKHKDTPSAKEIGELKKRVEDMKKKGDKAHLTAEDAICALKNCEKEWEAWAKAQKKQSQERYQQLIAMLGWMEKNRAEKEKREQKGKKPKKG